MCLATAYWAHISHIFFGAHVEDSRQYGNFQDDFIYADLRKRPDERKLKCEEFMRNEANEIWKKFAKMSERAQY